MNALSDAKFSPIEGAYRDINEPGIVGRTHALTECSVCHAAVPNTRDAMNAHTRWHGLNTIGLG